MIAGGHGRRTTYLIGLLGLVTLAGIAALIWFLVPEAEKSALAPAEHGGLPPTEVPREGPPMQALAEKDSSPPDQSLSPEATELARQRVRGVTGNLGLTADISDCKVVIDGKPLEGRKTLLALGDRLFVNEYQFLPPRNMRHSASNSYAFSVAQELMLLYPVLLDGDSANNNQALEQMAAFASSLPKMERAKASDSGISVYYEKGFLGGRMQLNILWFSPEQAVNSEAYNRCLRQRSENGIEDRFPEILEELVSGKTLVITSGGPS